METLNNHQVTIKCEGQEDFICYEEKYVKEFIRSLPHYLILDVKQIEILIKLAGDKLT